MIHHNEISDIELKTRMMQNEICCGGNIKLGIHGKMKCSSGKRMKKENRVFFLSEQEPLLQGYRPFGHCMNMEYKNGDGSIVKTGNK